jgi:hypothetical protein
MLAGVRPVAEASAGHWTVTVDGRHMVFDEPAAVGKFLQSLGLHSRLRHDSRATDALVFAETRTPGRLQAGSHWR